MNFAKKLFLSSVFAVGAFGLVACGDDKGSTAPDPNDPGTPVVVPTQQDANITLSSELVGDGLLTNSRLSGDNMRFKGRFGLDITQDSSENDINIQFTNIEYKVLDANNLNVAVAITSNPVTPTANDIDLNSINSAGVMVNMTDAGFTTCGNFSLVVTVTANNGVKDFFSTVQIPFEREAAEYCREENPNPEPQPQKQEVAMTSCEVVVSTNITPGIDLATCTASAAATADIIFAKTKVGDNNEITASSGSGVTFAPISNGDDKVYTDDYEVNMWPEDMNADRVPATAYVSDFKFKTAGPTLVNMIENSNQIYVALAPGYNTETGVGFYAFAIVDSPEGNNGDRDLTVKVYKLP